MFKRRFRRRHDAEQPVATADGMPPDERAAWLLGGDGWWGPDDEPLPDLLRRMATLPWAQAEVIPVRHPRMLAPAAVRALRAAAGPDLAEALAKIEEVSHHAYAGTLEWPLGTGPIDILLQRVLQRVSTLDEAATEAAAVGRRGDLIAPYARAIGTFAVRQAHEGVSEPALALATLILAAAEEAPTDPEDTVMGRGAWPWAADVYVEVARASLSSVPDDALFWRARELADRLLAWVRTESPHEEMLAWSLIGRFLLDVYVGDKGLERYDASYEAWQGRRRPLPLGEPEDQRPMPEPIPALREAVTALAAATGLGGTSASWKAYVQAQYALNWIDPEAAGHGAATEERIAVAEEALRHFDPEADADKITFVQLVLGDLVSGGAERAAASDEPLAELAQRVGARTAITTGVLRLQAAAKQGSHGSMRSPKRSGRSRASTATSRCARPSSTRTSRRCGRGCPRG